MINRTNTVDSEQREAKKSEGFFIRVIRLKLKKFVRFVSFVDKKIFDEN
jgi:hypothetical protein